VVYRVFIRNRGLEVEKERISVVIGAEFDIEAYKSFNWVMRLVRMLLIDTSKIC